MKNMLKWIEPRITFKKEKEKKYICMCVKKSQEKEKEEKYLHKSKEINIYK